MIDLPITEYYLLARQLPNVLPIVVQVGNTKPQTKHLRVGSSKTPQIDLRSTKLRRRCRMLSEPINPKIVPCRVLD